MTVPLRITDMKQMGQTYWWKCQCGCMVHATYKIRRSVLSWVTTTGRDFSCVCCGLRHCIVWHETAVEIYSYDPRTVDRSQLPPLSQII